MGKLYGHVYQRQDGLWEGRVVSGNRSTVGTTGNQGYKNRAAATKVLRNVLVYGDITLTGDTDTVVAAPRPKRFGRRTPRYTAKLYLSNNGAWEWRITAKNGNIVLVSHNQGYSSRSAALKTLRVIAGEAGHEV